MLEFLTEVRMKNELKIGFSNINFEEDLRLAKVLLKNTSLSDMHLSLNNIKISEFSRIAIWKGFSNLDHLEKLELYLTNIGVPDTDVEVIVNVILILPSRTFSSYSIVQLLYQLILCNK